MTVDVQNVGNPAIWDKITTGMAAGGVGLPDIMNTSIDYMPNYIETFPGALANLSEMGADEFESDFNSGVWESGSDAEGNVYGIPFEANTAAFFYRTDLFEEAGVDMATVETWDDLIEAGVKVKETSGAQLIGLDRAASSVVSADLWQMLALLQGSFYFNAEGDITMNNEAGVRALQIIKDMDDAGLILDVPEGTDEGSANLREGRLAASPRPSWYAGILPNDLPDMSGQWRVRTPPAVELGGLTGAVVGATHLAVSNTSENKDLAWDFVKFALADVDSQKTMYEEMGLFPAFAPMWETDGFVEEQEYYGGQAVNTTFIDQLEQETAGVNYSTDYARTLKLYTDAQTRVLLSDADPQEALDAAASQLAEATGRSIAAE